MFSCLPHQGLIFFKNAAGTVLTSAFSFWGPLASTDTRFQTPAGEVRNTSLFVVPSFTQRYLVTRLVDQGHYVWVSANEYYLITGLEDFGSQTTFVGLKQNIASAFTPSMAAGLVSEWAFESSAALLTDSQSRNNLTNTNAVTYSSDKPSEVPFNIGSALFVAASSQRLSIADASQMALDITGVFTIACRLKLTSNPAVVYGFLAKAGGAGNRAYICYVDTDRKVKIETSVDGTAQVTASGGTILSAGIWYSIGIVYDGTDIRIYLNGVLDSNGASNPRAKTDAVYDNTQEFALGARSDATLFLNGRLGHVFVFNQMKTAAQVSEWHSTDAWT